MRAALVAGVLIIAVVAWKARALPDAVGDVIDEAAALVLPDDIDMSNGNLRAFLQVIRAGEGTAGADGYRTVFGGGKFAGYADHPRQAITRKLGGRSITSTAAGAYQFLSGTWDECARALGLPDFGPESQDAAAAYLIRRRGALGDVYAGRFDAAVRKCAKEWASLPGSPYGQPTRTIEQASATYAAAGGVFA